MSIPEPLTPAEADLQDFPFIPLHVARLRDSDLAAEEHPEACWYAVLLWCASWHQLPAGSLPDNDTVLCKLIGLGRDVRTFRKHRAGALRGFVKCADGRLYHPVIAEQVIEAWDGKLHQRHRTFCAAIRKHNERNPDDRRDSPTFDAWLSLGCPANLAAAVTHLSRVTDPEKECDSAENERDIGSKGQGQGQGQSSKKETEADASDAAASPSLSDPDPGKQLFDLGIAVLGGGGATVPQARSMIGKWRKSQGDGAVLEALLEARARSITDPRPWIEGRWKSRAEANGVSVKLPGPAGMTPIRSPC